MSVTRRVWKLAKGEEIRGVEARDPALLGETLRRVALVVDPPFIAAKAGWHACTVDTDSGIVMIISCDDPGPDDELGAFAGSEATTRHLAPTPQEAEAIKARADHAEDQSRAEEDE